MDQKLRAAIVRAGGSKARELNHGLSAVRTIGHVDSHVSDDAGAVGAGEDGMETARGLRL